MRVSTQHHVRAGFRQRSGSFRLRFFQFFTVLGTPMDIGDDKIRIPVRFFHRIQKIFHLIAPEHAGRIFSCLRSQNIFFRACGRYHSYSFTVKRSIPGSLRLLCVRARSHFGQARLFQNGEHIQKRFFSIVKHMVVGQINQIHTQFFQYPHMIRRSPERICLAFHGCPRIRQAAFQIQAHQVCGLHPFNQLRIDTSADPVLLFPVVVHRTPVISQVDIPGKSQCKIIFVKIRLFLLHCQIAVSGIRIFCTAFRGQCFLRRRLRRAFFRRAGRLSASAGQKYAGQHACKYPSFHPAPPVFFSRANIMSVSSGMPAPLLADM